MSTSSTIVETKRALVQALRARPALSGVQVSYSHPGRLVEGESIYMGGARGEHEPAAIRAGRKPRTEVYTLDVLCEVSRRGGSVEEAEARALELLAEVESVLAEDPQLGGRLQWALASEIELDGGLTDDGAFVIGRLGVSCRARLD
jgi:hypothetical protein